MRIIHKSLTTVIYGNTFIIHVVFDEFNECCKYLKKKRQYRNFNCGDQMTFLYQGPGSVVNSTILTIITHCIFYCVLLYML